MRLYDAIETYRRRGERLIIIAGAGYGSGSSRDTAAKAPWLAGVRAVIAESYERIHRSNLVNMGILPLQFREGTNRHDLGLDGSETFSVAVDFVGERPQASLRVRRSNGDEKAMAVDVRLDTEDEVETWRNGGFFGRFLNGRIPELPLE